MDPFHQLCKADKSVLNRIPRSAGLDGGKCIVINKQFIYNFLYIHSTYIIILCDSVVAHNNISADHAAVLRHTESA